VITVYDSRRKQLRNGIAGINTNPFCASLTSVVDRLGLALQEADRVQLSAFAVTEARAFHDRETSWFAWNRTDPVLPSTCDRVTSEGEALLQRLNTALRAVGASTPLELEPPKSNFNLTDLAGALKWVAIAGVSIAGAVIIVPPILSILPVVRAGSKRAARALSPVNGVHSRRRRRK
jgi:hypothetical protein